jgi:ketosteroid isomerase-like protein
MTDPDVSPTPGAENLRTARRYLAALQAGAATEELAAFFTEDVVQEEFPNRLMSAGARRTLADLLEGAERGRTILTGQRFEIQREMADGDHVALEVIWTGRFSIPIGALQPGDEMRAHFGVFLDFRDGRIAAQRNYDCFDPF